MTYKDKIFKMLLELDGIFYIDEKVSPENRKEFMDIVEDCAKYQYFKDFIIELNKEKTKIKKISR